MKIIKFPFSGGGLGHGNGANKAPDVICKQFENIFSNESGEECKFEIKATKLNEKNIKESHDKIYNTVKKLNEKAILLGGDHSITYPTVKGFAENTSDFLFIVFDAHPDLMDDFTPPTQEDYLRVLIEQGIVKPKNVIIIGTRNWDKEEINYINQHSIKYHSCKDIYEKSFKEIINEVLAIVETEELPIYLSIDIDVCDPAFAPGTGYTEHGGICSRELIYAVQKLKQTNQIKMVDIVEVNPKKDINDTTSILAAKLCAELYGY